MINKLIPVFTAALVLGATSGIDGAAAQTSETVKMKVSAAGLDLSTETGVGQLKRRILHGAIEACRTDLALIEAIADYVDDTPCVKALVNQAMSQFDLWRETASRAAPHPVALAQRSPR